MRSALLTVVLLCSAHAVAAAPVVTFIKDFPASTPPYISIELKPDGTAVLREKPASEETIEFKLPDNECKEIFALVEKLDRFKRPLESNLKVANMGRKTFRYVDGSVQHEQHFNYSLDPDAQLLHDWFERISDTQILLWELERTAKFDKLGVNKTLLQIEAARDRKRLAGAERLLPLLDRVANGSGYVNMARERAGALAAYIRSPKPAATTATPE